MNNSKRKVTIWIIIFFLLGCSAGFAAAIIGMRNVSDVSLVNSEYLARLVAMDQKYAKLDFLYGRIMDDYYGEYDEEELMNGIYKGLFSSLDIYSTYLTNEEYAEIIESSTGTFSGVGVSMSITNDNKIIVLGTIEGSPASKAGLQSGDIILEVNGVAYQGSELDVAVANLRGEKGTSVTLTYLSNGEKKEVTLVREDITTSSVTSAISEDNIGYIRIGSFETNTGKDFEKILRDMEFKKVKGIIIDLRYNGGGVVDSSVEIADLLLPECTIISTEDNKGETKYFTSDADATSLAYVLLVNEHSASASEILAVAIKENKGGKLVGVTTFGKGVMQEIVGIGSRAGESGAVKITCQEYFGPEHVKINGVGIEPDYYVELSSDPEDNQDYQLIKAMELLK